MAKPQQARATGAIGRNTARRGLLWFAGLAPVIIGLIIGVLLNGTRPVERLRNIVFDEFQQLAPRPWTPDLPVRIVDIDDDSLARLGQWPWPRQRLAELTNKLIEQGAAVVAYDSLFAEPDRLASREVLSLLPASPERDALEKTLTDGGALDADPLEKAFRDNPVVIGMALSNRPTDTSTPMKSQFVRLGDDPTAALPFFRGMILPLPHLREAAAGMGAINYIPDVDLILRRVPLVFAVGDGPTKTLVPGLAGEALRVAFRTDTPIIKASNASGETNFGSRTSIVAVKIGDAEIPTERDGEVRIRFAGSQPGRILPVWKILDGSVDRNEIDGRIMLVGSSAAGLSDLRSTPIDSAVPGVEVHAELIEHALTGSRLARPDWMLGAEAVALLIGGLAVAFLARRLPPTLAALAAFILVCVCVLGSWYLFRYQDLLFDPVIPSASWLATYLGVTFVVYRQSEQEKRFVRGAFQRYLSPSVVEQLAADPSRLKLGGETRDVSILFSDARDFTTRAETLDAEGVVRFLNALHTPLTGAVLAEGGTIDKYIGDGLMAFWNAPLVIAGHANHACAAALAMQAAIPGIDAALRTAAEADGRPHTPLAVGIGLNAGSVFVGNMGSNQRFDYSIVGDPVNIAARLETATKELGVPIVASAAIRAAAPAYGFVELGAFPLKGKSEPQPLYALHGRRDRLGADFARFEKLHKAVLEGVSNSASNVAERIAAAAGTADGAPYLTFYERISGAKKIEIEGEKSPGGS
ncbi:MULTISPECIES: adenylate/guanylate cyclase domain-containing protein [unclassified Beijerinckia]|uniref:CHASE2 domain-containing protein n=1 Tax=unclassified Beijerinckia TaxID=2638183 RepID=UPI00089C747D|nr:MULTISPECIES: adenylate/guanylate cyclase domain-containing protein [unclassified Beijerinckia]MDH7795513.1 adenylate cyclase [Beijerinckia sp. GAS462]SEC04712.1 adenylate cyclase [Beijerinckia sp. 28-YEA-48]